MNAANGLSNIGRAAVAAAAPSRPGGVNSRPAAASNASTISNGSPNRFDAVVTVAPSALGFPLTGRAPAPPLPPFSGDTVAAYAASAATPGERCTDAARAMGECLTPKDQIEMLEDQADVACIQCDKLRTQIAKLKKQKQIGVPAPTAPSAATTRYGITTKVGAVSVLPNGDSEVCTMLPTLRDYAAATPNQPVKRDNYQKKIKPLVDRLSKNSRPQFKALRNTLKTYDPPGTFMSLFKKPKSAAGLANVATQVGNVVGCPTAGPIGNIEHYKENKASSVVGGARRKSQRKATTRKQKHRNH